MMKSTFMMLMLVTALICTRSFGSEPEVLHFSGKTAAELNKLIDEAPDHSIIRLAPVTYQFDEPIVILRSHITLRGSGRDKTRLQFRWQGANAGDFMMIMGGHRQRIGRLVRGAQRSADTIELAMGHRLGSGDVLYISQPNSAPLLEKYNWQNLPTRAAQKRPLREALASVSQVKGRSIQLDSALPFDFPKRISTVHKVHAIRDVTVSDLTILSNRGMADPRNFSNTLTGIASRAAIRMARTVDSRIERVDIIDAPSKGIALDTSLRVALQDIHIDGSHNKGTGGEGYGIELRETFDSLLLELTILNTRHAVLFSSWHMEAGNKVHIRQTNRDVNFHGGLDHSNVVIIDNMALVYDMSHRGGRPKFAWSAISKGGRTHPNTNFFASNTFQMKQVTSSWRNDILIASEEGSRLNSQAGYDVIIGGPGRDVASGGPDADIFLLGAGNDVIMDFDTGVDGDSLWVPFSFSQIDKYASQSERGLLIKWDEAGSVFLEKVKLAQLKPRNISKCVVACRARILEQRHHLNPEAPQF